MKIYHISVMLVMCLCWLIGVAGAQQNAALAIDSDIVDVVKGGEIDWENGYIYAKGIGAVPPASKVPNRAIAKLKAQDYAKMDAIANLLMAIEGTAVSYDGLGKDYMADVTLRQTIKGYVHNVEIVASNDVKDKTGSYVVVTIRKAMFGEQTPGQAFLRKIAANQTADVSLRDKKPRLIEIPVEKLPSERAQYLESDAGWERYSKYPVRGSSLPASSRPVDINETYELAPQKGPFTGLIIDTRGYDVKRAMAPKIRKQNGEVIWGDLPADPDIVSDQGVASYVKSLEDARNNQRAGKNPLLVIVVGRAGGAAMCDAIVSDRDGDFIVENNKNDKFLDTFNVVFVTDPTNKRAAAGDRK